MAEHGHCGFDPDVAAFRGDIETQMRCLLSPVLPFGHVKQPLAVLPKCLADCAAGRPLPTIGQVRAYLAKFRISEADIGGDLAAPVSRTTDGELARYFVIHDTSAPLLGDKPFPEDIDTSHAVNIAPFESAKKRGPHVFVNRLGEAHCFHDFAARRGATKFEFRVLKPRHRGLFLHAELIQPRRRDPRGKNPNNDAMAPMPGFTDIQLDCLALVYIAASLRRGAWFIPAYHAVIDFGIEDGHDDPQNFDLELWSGFVDAVLDDMAATG